jgi:hypothetical protein
MVGEPVRRRATRLFYRRTTEPTGRVTRSVRHNNTKQQGACDDASLQPRKDVPQSSNCNNNRATIIGNIVFLI